MNIFRDKKFFLKEVIYALDSVNFGTGHERDYILENLAMLIAGGMTITTALHAVKQEIHSRSTHRVLDRLLVKLENGTPLWKAFQESGMFKPNTVSLIRVGEETGKLSENLKLVAMQEKKERDFSSKIRSAMLYPVFVLGLTVIMGVLIAWFILPRLANVFAQLKVELPLITKILISAGLFLGQYGYLFFPIFFAVLLFFFYFVFFFSKTKFIGQNILFSFPGLHTLIQEVELARFGYLLGTLLQAGVPVTQALDSLANATSSPSYKKLYLYLHVSIEDGNSFQKSFTNYKNIKKLIPVPIQQLVIAGEQSGNLSEILLSVSKNFEEKTEQTTKNISVILEPVLLVIVWLGVVSVALAVILPIYSLIGGFNADPSVRLKEETPQVITEQKIVEPVVAESVLEDDNYTITTLVITENDAGYVNVRNKSSVEGDVVSQVLPGEEYAYVKEQDGWYKIVLPFEETGWISGDYIYVVKTQ